MYLKTYQSKIGIEISSSFKILAVIFSFQLILTEARSLNNKIMSNSHRDMIKPACNSFLCKTSRSYKAKAKDMLKPVTEEHILSRKKRTDADVKIAEYIAWMAMNGHSHSNCRDIACGLIDVIDVDQDSRGKRSTANTDPTLQLVQGHSWS